MPLPLHECDESCGIYYDVRCPIWTRQAMLPGVVLCRKCLNTHQIGEPCGYCAWLARVRGGK